MVAKKEETKEKIIQATIRMLDETDDPNEITIRGIAERVGIGVGLINYHFDSRENLLHLAASERMTDMAEAFASMKEVQTDPEDSLKTMLKSLVEFGIQYDKFIKISAEYELLKGDFRLCLYLMPALKTIYGGRKTEGELRFIAFQIIISMQVMFIRQDAFYLFTGFNTNHREDRDRLIELMVDNFVGKEGEKS